VTFFSYGSEKDPDAKTALVNAQLLERVRAMPGVQAASTAFPSAFGNNATMTLPVDFEAAKQERINTLVVGAGYFDVMRIPLARGRAIDARDAHGSAEVVVVNETLTQAHWPGQDPLGRRLTVRWDDDAHLVEVIGVARDVRHLGLDVPPAPELYLPSSQWVMPASALLVRSQLGAAALLPALRRELHALDKDLAVDRAEGMPALLTQSLAQRRFTLTLLSLFAFVAVALATLGIYGITSYAVSRRTRELGIRLALGARPGQVVELVLRRTLMLTGLGLALGLGMALLLGDVLRGLVYEISPADPLTLGALAAALFGLAALASYLPARRATRVDLLLALRSE
jgi:putative ABC transport system permease protein